MKTLSFFVFFVCCVAIVEAQERVMDKAAFDAVVSEGSQHTTRWKGEKYRMTVATSTRVAGQRQSDYSSKMIFEWGSGSEFRSVSTSKFGDNPVAKREMLYPGNCECVYSRSGEGSWTRKERQKTTNPAPEKKESPFDVVASEVKYAHVGAGSLLNKPVQIYVKTERGTTQSKSNGHTTESDVKVTYWIDADGIVLKREYASENRSAAVTSHTSVVTEWELDPSISFTAPEIVP